MLTPQDDFIGHQLPTTFDHVGSSDPAWMERLWYTAHPTPGGDAIIDIGLGYYPNKNVMDAFAGITVGGVQYNLRVSRRLRPLGLKTEIGPLSISVVEGFVRHRIVVAQNDSGIACDLEFFGTMNPHEEEPHFRRRNGRVTEHMARMEQLGLMRGWFEANGVRHILDDGRWLAQRDHSWGIRAEMRTDPTSPPETFYPPFFYCWTTAQFANRGLHIFFKERAPGSLIYISGEDVLPLGQKPKANGQLDAVAHDAKWAVDPCGQTLEAIEFEATFADRSSRKIQVRTLPGRFFLKGGLYGGLNGWFHGDEKGRLFLDHNSWDHSDPEARRVMRTLSDHVIEVHDQGEVGYGIIEYGVGTDYARYEEVQRHPPI
jgi:hypothetical protein